MCKILPPLLAALATMLYSPVCFAVAPRSTGQSTDTIDLSLGTDGRLAGTLVNSSGLVVGDSFVEILGVGGRVAALVRSREDGRFIATGLNSGVYLVRSRECAQICRCWAAGTAPPAVVSELLLVDDAAIARGGLGSIPWKYVIPLGLVAGGVVAYRVSQDTAS